MGIELAPSIKGHKYWSRYVVPHNAEVTKKSSASICQASLGTWGCQKGGIQNKFLLQAVEAAEDVVVAMIHMEGDKEGMVVVDTAVEAMAVVATNLAVATTKVVVAMARWEVYLKSLKRFDILPEKWVRGLKRIWFRCLVQKIFKLHAFDP